MTSTDYLSIIQGWTRVPLSDAPGEMNYALQTSIKQGQGPCATS